MVTLKIYDVRTLLINSNNAVTKIQQDKYLLQKSWKNWASEISSRPLFVFWKSLIWGKSKCSAA